jgi:hypothetical protein
VKGAGKHNKCARRKRQVVLGEATTDLGLVEVVYHDPKQA